MRALRSTFPGSSRRVIPERLRISGLRVRNVWRFEAAPSTRLQRFNAAASICNDCLKELGSDAWVISQTSTMLFHLTDCKH